MVYHDAGLEEDGPHAVVRNKATGAMKCRPPVSVPGYLARKLPLPPPPTPQQQHQRRRSHQQQQGATPVYGLGWKGERQEAPARTQRWAVTERHLLPGPSGGGGGGRVQQYVTVVREDREGGPRICGPRESWSLGMLWG